MEAIAKYKEALTLHEEPSGVLENLIGFAYGRLREHELAIAHYTNAIQIQDNSIDRVGRSIAYIHLEQCDKAIVDAKAALALKAAFDEGYHTDVEANYILSDCYFWDEEYLLSLQHIDAAIAIAKEHRYPNSEIASMEEEREIIQSYLE